MTQLTVQPEDAMASAALKTQYTPSQYLALERVAEFKHEYYDGYITAMAFVSPEHNRIALNIASRLNTEFKNRECQAFVSDIRLCVSSTGLYTYPDVMAVCGESRFQNIEGVESLLNPTIIVEVLSPTTESYDRGAKFGHYRQLPSLKEYVLVSQDKVLVERYTRQGDDWVLSEFKGRADTLQLLSIDCAVSLREIYAKVKFTASVTLLTVQPEDAMASAALKTRYTPSQYLALERDADFKHEYFDGYITAMAGVSPEHNQIALNFASTLNTEFKNRECQAFMSDIRLCVSSTGLYTYPDVMAVCGEALFQKIEGVDSLLNPTIIVEVLSPTTESYDRDAKFDHYRQLPSLKEYVLVSQDKLLVERFTRKGDGWVRREFKRLADTLQLRSIDCAVPLREIYAKVNFVK